MWAGSYGSTIAAAKQLIELIGSLGSLLLLSTILLLIVRRLRSLGKGQRCVLCIGLVGLVWPVFLAATITVFGAVFGMFRDRSVPETLIIFMGVVGLALCGIAVIVSMASSFVGVGSHEAGRPANQSPSR